MQPPWKADGNHQDKCPPFLTLDTLNDIMANGWVLCALALFPRMVYG